MSFQTSELLLFFSVKHKKDLHLESLVLTKAAFKTYHKNSNIMKYYYQLK